MAYTDKQLMAFSEIAYLDLDTRVQQYLKEHPNETSVKLTSLNLTADEKSKIEQFVPWPGYSDWAISATDDDKGFGKSGFAACIIETSSTEPKEAAIAFRGSGDMSDPESLVNDWILSDAGLVDNDKTLQEYATDRFLSEHKQLIEKYNNVSMVGHSLGGALADYATVKSVEMGLDSKVTQCANLDGPGHSQRFISNNKDAIDKVKEKMTHYEWSRVGAQLWNISGTEKYIETDDKYKTNGSYSLTGFFQHARTAPQWSGDNLQQSEEYKIFCELQDLGGNSRLLDASKYKLGVWGTPLYFVEGMFSATLLTGFAVAEIIGSTAESIIDWGADRINDIINFFFGGSDDSETPEQTAARLAANEASEYISFTINPISFLSLSESADEISLNVMFTGTSLDTLTKGTTPDGTNIESIRSTVLNPYGSSAVRQLNIQIKDMYDKIKTLQEAAERCKALIDPIQNTIGGCIDYLNLTGNEFIEVENDAKSRISSWY